MWKDYSIGFIKKNRASSVSVLVAAFISALFLSLLCGLFYNFWNYEIESVVLEEGNWQGRISGALEEDELSEIENFANVKTAAINSDSHHPNLSPVISGYKQPSKSAQSIEITGFIEKSKPPKIIFFYTLLPLTA